MHDDSGTTPFDGSLLLELVRLGAVLRRNIDAEIRENEVGVSAVETDVLELIDHTPLATATYLARQLAISRQAVRKLLYQLEDRGLITLRDKVSTQPLRCTLTGEGAFLLMQGKANAADLEERLLGGVDEATWRLLRATVTKLLSDARFKPWRHPVYGLFG